MYLYVYVYMFIFTYIHVCTCMYMYIYKYVYVCRCMNRYIYTHTYTYVGIGKACDGPSAGAHVNGYKTKGNKQEDETIQQIAKKFQLDPHTLLQCNREQLANLGNNTGRHVLDNLCIYMCTYTYIYVS